MQQDEIQSNSCPSIAFNAYQVDGLSLPFRVLLSVRLSGCVSVSDECGLRVCVVFVMMCHVCGFNIQHYTSLE